MVDRLDREAAARQVAIALASLSAFLRAASALGVLRQTETFKAAGVELQGAVAEVMVKYRLPSIPNAELLIQWTDGRLSLPEIMWRGANLARELREAQCAKNYLAAVAVKEPVMGKVSMVPSSKVHMSVPLIEPEALKLVAVSTIAPPPEASPVQVTPSSLPMPEPVIVKLVPLTLTGPTSAHLP